MGHRRKGLLSLHSAILIFGGTALFSKLIALPAADITIWRSFVAAGVLLLLHSLRRRSIALTHNRDGLIMMACGVLLGLHWVTYFQSMQIAGVAIGIIAMYTYPILIVFIEPLFKGEKPQLTDIACAMVMFMGVLLLVPEFNLHNDITVGVMWGLLSAFLFAIRNVLQGHYLRDYRGDTSILYQGFVAGLVSVPLISTHPLTIDTRSWLLLIILGSLFTAVPHSLFANSLRFLKAKSVGLIGCLQPVYGTLLAFVILSEQPTWATLLGGSLIVGTAAFESYRT